MKIIKIILISILYLFIVAIINAYVTLPFSKGFVEGAELSEEIAIFVHSGFFLFTLFFVGWRMQTFFILKDRGLSSGHSLFRAIALFRIPESIEQTVKTKEEMKEKEMQEKNKKKDDKLARQLYEKKKKEDDEFDKQLQEKRKKEDDEFVKYLFDKHKKV